MKRGFLKSNKAQSALLSLTPAAKPTLETDGIVRLAYGVVENPGIPEGYKLNKLAIVEADPHQSYDPSIVSPYRIIYTTLPSVPKDRNYVDYPDGWTECVIPPPVKHLIVTHPGFPGKPPRPILPLPYEIRVAPGMGLGLYATRNIMSGELIIAERPLVLVSLMLGHDGGGYNPETTTLEQYKQVLLAEKEQEVRIMFDRMLPEDQATFMALANDHLHDGSGPIMGIIRTNGFGIDCYQLPEEKQKGELFGYCSVVTRILSRANHSCEPTVDREFDPVTFSMQAWAARYIRKGEALTVTYCDTNTSYDERQAELARYGFACECTKCRRERPSKF